MLNINITVRDVALNVSRDFTIAIDEQLQMRDLIALLVRKLAWPERYIEGQTISYALRVERANSTLMLTGDEPVRSAGLLNGDVITIGPQLAVSDNAMPLSRSTQQPSETSSYTIAPLKRSY